MYGGHTREVSAIGIPPIFVKWVKGCITTPQFSIATNGNFMLFTSAHEPSMRIVLNFSDEFHSLFGLDVNQQKSELFFLGVDGDLRKQIVSLLGFCIGKLTMRYLGVPLMLWELFLNIVNIFLREFRAEFGLGLSSISILQEDFN
ncbi:hypothetical protein SO802_015051 [Lithocarpus litseifolius]|uniref:Reverse transcriptase domain-containing protein n=1 Tax=Lithocarpus litseifolius TaxID=425828 RepID=A0AAW2CWS0_9ROSI